MYMFGECVNMCVLYVCVFLEHAGTQPIVHNCRELQRQCVRACMFLCGSYRKGDGIWIIVKYSKIEQS